PPGRRPPVISPRPGGSARMASYYRSGVLAALLLAAAGARGQDPDRPPDPVLPGGGSAADLVEANDRLPRIARLLPEDAARREWHTAAHALHMLLDTPPGVLTRRVEMDADGKPYVHWHSPQVRVNEIFAKLPPEALKVYSEEYGRPARELLAKAKKG